MKRILTYGAICGLATLTATSMFHISGGIDLLMTSSVVQDVLRTVLIVVLVTTLFVDSKYEVTVLVACILGVILHMGLEVFGAYFESKQSHAKVLVGWAAFASFMYLEVLDASFSFDGVIGAFAITNNIILIITGLAAGAIWVRSLTIYLLRAGTLSKYRYLEHGAHWAILALGIVMFVKLYHVQPPEIVTGSLGLVFIGTAVATSVIEKRRQENRLATKAAK